MKFTASLVLSLLLIPTAVVEGGIFDILIRPLIQQACASAATALGLGNTVTCSCDAVFLGLFQGIAGDLSCVTNESVCFEKYCGTGSVNASLAGSLVTGTGITGEIDLCVVIDLGIAPEVITDPELCLTFIPEGTALKSCTAAVNGVNCDECLICESGAAFTFNCTNVDLLPDSPLKIDGPAIDTCIGLDLLV